MKTKAIGSRLLACLAVSLLAVGCADAPTDTSEQNDEGIIPSGPFVSFSHATGPGCVTVDFDAGSGFPLSYTESGIIATSLYPTSPHLHLDGVGFLFNHSFCCSTPYEFKRVDGAAFTVASLDVVGGSGTG